MNDEFYCWYCGNTVNFADQICSDCDAKRCDECGMPGAQIVALDRRWCGECGFNANEDDIVNDDDLLRYYNSERM